VIHGDADREVPVKHGLRIFELGGGAETFWAVPGGGHVTAMSEEQSGGYRLKLVEYLNDL
jgi:pimeloyl-ACP methyl ester carboxylesterase